MEQSPYKISLKTIVISASCILAAFAVSYYGQPYIDDNKEAVNIIVTVFSILAGFLIAIMTVIGDPGTISGRSSQYKKLKAPVFVRRLKKKMFLFVVYLLTLALIFIDSLLRSDFPRMSSCLQYTYLWFAAWAFIRSLLLPWRLYNIQIERYREIYETPKGEKKMADPP